MPINSPLDDTYRRNQLELSQKLADHNPNMICDFLVEMVQRLEMCNTSGQKQLLTVLIPWLRCLNRYLQDSNHQFNFDLIFEVRTLEFCITTVFCLSGSRSEFIGNNSAICRRSSNSCTESLDHSST